MDNLFLIIGALILIFYKKLRVIFKVYWNQFRRYRNGTPCYAQHSSFLEKHVNSLWFIRNIHFNDSECVRLATAQASDLDEHLQNCYQELPCNVTILSTQPAFSNYKHFFGDCYYTEDAVLFYEYKTEKKIIVRHNQHLFVCFTNFDRRPLEIHMCDQRCFLELLEVYNTSVALLVILTILFIFTIICNIYYTNSI